MKREWEEYQGRAALGAIRMVVMITGALAVFPLGCWLAVEHWDSKTPPLYGGLLLMVLAGVLVEGIAHEIRRVSAWNAEARRLRWQAENDFPPPGGAADLRGEGSAAIRGGGSSFAKATEDRDASREPRARRERGASSVEGGRR